MKYLAIGILTTALLIACGSGGDGVTDPPPGAITVTLEVTPTASITTAGAVMLRATAGANVSSVEFYKGETRLTTDSAAPFSHSLNVSSSDNGTLVFSAKAFAGAASQVSASVSRTVNIATPTPFNVRVTGRGSFISYDIAVDTQDRPAILYKLTDAVTPENSGTFVNFWTGSAWQTTTNVLAAPEAFFTPVALKFVGGKPTVFGTTTRNSVVRPIIPAGIVVRQWNGSSWEALGVVGRPPGFSPSSDLELMGVLQQTDGVIVLATRGFTTGDKVVIQAARFIGSSWVFSAPTGGNGSEREFFLSNNALAYLSPDATRTKVAAFVQDGSATRTLTKFVNSTALLLINAGVNGERPVIQTFERPTATTTIRKYRRWNLTTELWDDVGVVDHLDVVYSRAPRHPLLAIEIRRLDVLVRIDTSTIVVRELSGLKDTFNATVATSDSSGALITFADNDGGLGVSRIAP